MRHKLPWARLAAPAQTDTSEQLMMVSSTTEMRLNVDKTERRKVSNRIENAQGQTRRTSFCVVGHLCVRAIDTLLDRTARSALLWSLLLVDRATQTNQSQPRRCANGKHTHEDCVQPLPLVADPSPMATAVLLRAGRVERVCKIVGGDRMSGHHYAPNMSLEVSRLNVE